MFVNGKNTETGGDNHRTGMVSYISVDVEELFGRSSRFKLRYSVLLSADTIVK